MLTHVAGHLCTAGSLATRLAGRTTSLAGRVVARIRWRAGLGGESDGAGWKFRLAIDRAAKRAGLAGTADYDRGDEGAAGLFGCSDGAGRLLREAVVRGRMRGGGFGSGRY